MGYDSEICLARSLILQLVVSVVAMVACVCVDWSTGFRGHLYVRQGSCPSSEKLMFLGLCVRVMECLVDFYSPTIFGGYARPHQVAR